MKKVVTLMLVLGMASMASAAMVNLTLSTTDDTDNVLVGSIITVDLTFDQNMTVITNTTGVDFTVTGATNGVALGAWANDPITSPADATSNGTLNGTNIEDAWVAYLTKQVAGTVLYSFELTINEDGTLGLADVGAGEIKDPAILMPPSYYTIGEVAGFDVTIPEPATMALLGLGSLLLRRKK